jgi:hypothetical protein
LVQKRRTLFSSSRTYIDISNSRIGTRKEFEEIKMLEDETFGEFYSKMSDLRNSMVSLGKPISNVKLIRKILRSLPEHFRIKVTTIEESKDLGEMRLKSWWDLFKHMSCLFPRSRS